MSVELQIVMPVHNEAGVIGTTLKEWHEALSPRVNVQFILTEDGSKDGTKEVLTKLAARYPILLDMSEKRRGYTEDSLRPVMRSATNPFSYRTLRLSGTTAHQWQRGLQTSMRGKARAR